MAGLMARQYFWVYALFSLILICVLIILAAENVYLPKYSENNSGAIYQLRPFGALAWAWSELVALPTFILSLKLENSSARGTPTHRVASFFTILIGAYLSLIVLYATMRLQGAGAVLG